MFLPIGTDRPRRRPTAVTYWLMGLCVVAFVGQTLILRQTPRGEAPAFAALIFDPGAGRWWQLLTYQFLHADLMHLLGNMLFLWVFGPPVEDRFRRVGFTAFYLVGGVVAGLAHQVFGGGPVLGASGSISAVTGAFLILFPLTRVRILLMFFLIGVFMIPAWWFIAFAVVKDLWFSAMGGRGVAYAAHLGGYAFGAVIPLLLLWRKILPREPYDLFSIGRQAHRRRQFRGAVTRGRGGGSPWSADQAKQGRVVKAQKAQRPARSTAEEEWTQRQRSAVTGALSEGDVERATKLYVELLERRPDAVLHRDAQVQIANHLFQQGAHQTAAQAYELLLKRGRRDRESDQVRLMLALINARYLNDPVRASTLLGEVRENQLGADQRELMEAIRGELG